MQWSALYHYQQAWEPSVAQVTYSYSRRLLALGHKLRFEPFFTLKADLLNLESQNKAKNITVDLPSSQINIWGKSANRFQSDDRTNKQSNKDYYFIYIIIVQFQYQCPLYIM